MEFAVDTVSISIDKFEGVRPVAIHVTMAIGQTSITEQKRHLHSTTGKEMMSAAKFSVPNAAAQQNLNSYLMQRLRS